MSNKAYYIILEDDVLLSKKEYNHWREIQAEYYENFKACLGPWTCEEFISYFEDDFGKESKWPFLRETLINFFKGSDMILCSNR